MLDLFLVFLCQFFKCGLETLLLVQDAFTLSLGLDIGGFLFQGGFLGLEILSNTFPRKVEHVHLVAPIRANTLADITSPRFLWSFTLNAEFSDSHCYSPLLSVVDPAF